MKRKSLLFLLLFALIAPFAANAQQTLTVHDGTGTNSNVPVHGLWADAYLKCEMVYPAAELGSMSGGTINSIKFYASTPATASWGNANFQVFVAEVDYTTISDFAGPGTIVYEGALDGTQSEVEITFSSPYAYNGGNLLVGVYNTVKGTYKSITWAGETVSGASVQGYSSSSLSSVSPTQRNFLPKTTFNFTNTSPYIALSPSAATVFTGFTTTLTATYGNVTDTPTITYTTSDANVATVTGTGTSATVTAVAPGTATITATMNGTYTATCAITVEDPSYCTPAFSSTTDYITNITLGDINNTSGFGTGGYSDNTSMSTDLSADETYTLSLTSSSGSGTHAAAVWIDFDDSYTFETSERVGTQDGIGASVTVDIPLAIPNDAAVGSHRMRVVYQYNVTGANINPCASASYGEGEDYTVMILAASICKTPSNLDMTEIGKRSAKLKWTENGVATAWEVEVTDLDGGQVTTWNAPTKPYEILGLTPETNYSVRVKPVCEDERWSTPISFTTLVACPAPTDLTIVPTNVKADVSWEGDANEYEVWYRPVVHGQVLESQDFEDSSMGDWTTIDADGDGFDWQLASVLMAGYTIPSHGEGEDCVSSQSYDSDAGALTPDNYLVSPQITLGGSITFWAQAQDASYAAEHFGVAVSTTGNTDANDFTTIQEWTMTAKSGSKAGNGNYMTRSGNRASGTWYQFTVDLSAYSGQGYVAIRHFNCTDWFYLNVDDIVIESASNAGAWTKVTVSENHYLITGLTELTEYEVQVRSICGGEDGESAWNYTTFTTLSQCADPFDLDVPEATLMPTTATLAWNGCQDSYNVWYRPIAQGAVLESIDFDDSSMGNWTNIDADGDGYVWVLGSACGGIYLVEGSDLSGNGHESSTDFVTSGSYSNYLYNLGEEGALTPDNYLVSPQVQLGGSITFWACAQDADWASEHFGVAVSTTGNTNASDFTTIQEWTMTAKGVGATVNPGTTRSGNRAQGTWYQYTVDLSAYSGMGYVAIRHFNCTDFFMLNVDDITINAPAEGGQTWTQLVVNGTSKDITGLIPEGTTYEWKVQGINTNCDGGLTAWVESTFVTPGYCDDPVALSAEVDGTNVTLSWTGYQDSFDVTYYIAETGTLNFEDDDFEGDWTYDEEDENIGWANLGEDDDPIWAFGFISTATTAEYFISPEMEDVEGASLLGFTYFAPVEAETFSVGYSTTGKDVENDFTWLASNTVTGQGWHYEAFPEGVKYFGIKYDSDHVADTSYLFVLWFTLYDNYIPEGTHTTLSGVTSPQTITGLDENSIYYWEVVGINDDCESDMMEYDYFLTEEVTQLTQTTALIAGQNWFSTYLEITLDDLKAALLAALPNAASGSIQIKSQNNGQCTWLRGNIWSGQLKTMDVAQMYKIVVPVDCEITLVDDLIDPAAHPITITANSNNWIGFPFSESMSITNAFAALPPTRSDALKSAADGQANFVGRWTGALKTLEPGKGYIYQSKATYDKTFVYPTSKAAKKGNSNSIIRRKSLKDMTVSLKPVKPATKD